MSIAPYHLLEQTIAVLRRNPTTDDDGVATYTWATHLASVSARVEPGSGNHDANADRPTASRRYRIYLDSHHQVRPTDCIVYAGKALRIVDLLDHGPTAPLMQILVEEDPQ